MSSSQEFRSRVACRERLIGIFVKTIDHSVIEILGHRTGVDFVVLDLEHSSASPERIDSCILAARAVSLPLLVRVPSATSEYVAHTLDMGASGILFPRISTHVEAANAVGKMRFRGGERGFSLSHRAGYFGRLSPQQFVEANDHNLLAAVQIEDPEAVKNADKIASVPGVDVNFVGPADLQVALAENPESEEGSLQCQIREALKKTIDNQGIAGIYLAGLQDVEHYLDLGVSFFVVSTDQAVLGSGVESLISDFKPYLGDP